MHFITDCIILRKSYHIDLFRKKHLLAAGVSIPPPGEETALLRLLGVANPPGGSTGVLGVALLAGQTLEQGGGPMAAGASSARGTGTGVGAGAAARGGGGRVGSRGGLESRARSVSVR